VKKWLVNYIPKNYEKREKCNAKMGWKTKVKLTTRQIVKARRRGGERDWGGGGGGRGKFTKNPFFEKLKNRTSKY
jgi:hypothetical protein